MNLYFAVFIGGLLSFLTPVVIPFLISIPLIFEKLGISKKHYKTNVLFFVVFTLLVYAFIISPIISAEYIIELSYNSNLYILLHGAQIIFLIWFLRTFIEKLKIRNRKILNQFFRFFGILILSIRLGLSSLANVGPLLGSMLIAEATDSGGHNIEGTLLVFAIGLLLPFVIVLWLFVSKYDKLKWKKWWIILQLIIAGFLFLGSMVQLIALIK